MREGRGEGAPAVARLAGLSFVLWLLAPDAGAYIDPGTGSYVFQTVVAALVTAAFLLRTFWHRVIAFLHRRRRRPTGKVEPGSRDE